MFKVKNLINNENVRVLEKTIKGAGKVLLAPIGAQAMSLTSSSKAPDHSSAANLVGSAAAGFLNALGN